MLIKVVGEKEMYKIGIDLGGTNIKIGIVNEENKIVARTSISTFAERPYQQILKDMGLAALHLLKENDILLEECVGGAEFGHTVIISDGEECSCGRKGCFEAYASAKALIRDTKRAILDNPNCLMSSLCQNDLDKVDGQLAFEAMKQGDEIAKIVVENYIKYLSIAITNLINIFRPDKVLIGGGVCNQEKVLTEEINKYIKENCFGGTMVFVPEVQIAELGNDAGIIGAAGLMD